MKRPPVVFCVVGLALALVSAACGDSVRPPAATVNGTKISQVALDDELQAIEHNTDYVRQIEGAGATVRGKGKGTLSNAFVSRVLTRQIFLQLVHNEIIRRKLAVPTGDVRSGEQQAIQSVGGEAVWKKFPKSYQQTLLRRSAEVGVLQNALSDVKVDAAAIQKFYEANAEQFSQTCASHILFSVPGDGGAPDQQKTAAQIDTLRAQAEDVKKQIDAGADFAAMAKQYSTDTSNKDQGGDLQCGAAGRFVPEFDTALAALAVGQVSGPVQTQFGIHLIKVTDRKKQSLEEATPQIQQQLQGQGQQGLSKFLQDALPKAKVSVNPRYGTFSKDGQNPGVVPPDAPPTTQVGRGSSPPPDPAIP